MDLEIETFKCQLFGESYGFLDEDNPATYSIILMRFADKLNETQINKLNEQLMKAKAKLTYINRNNIYSSDLKPYDPNEVPNNYVVRREQSSPTTPQRPQA